MKRKLTRKFLQAFDLSFYKGSGYQYLWIVAIMVIVFLVWWIISLFYDIEPWRLVELMLDPGSFAGSADESDCVWQIWVQFLVTLTGAVVFTSFIINVIGNSLGRRLEAFTHGQVTYRFKDHVLILGSNGMLVNILKSLVADPENKDRDIVVLTSKDVEKVREYVNSYIPATESKNIYVVYGDRTINATLESVEAQDAMSIYILGEDNEQMHDARNLACWASLKEVCADAPNPVNCFLVLERISTEHVFYYKSDSGSFKNLRLTVINELENAAQRVLVSREYEDGIKYPALDRDGISKDSEVAVHFVIVGMTQMAYAMAMTAAHVCHFPNFATNRKRTKITFIQKDIRQEMDFFRGHFSNLMDLSYAEYMSWDKSDGPYPKVYEPKSEYLAPGESKYGFLDVEWEFLDGGIESEPVREYLEKCAEKDGVSEYLTIAICEHEPETNVAAALYMPSIVYKKNIPILVYQNSSGEVLRTAKKSSRFDHIYPFGMKSECYDAQYKKRLIRAKRISYLYDNSSYVSMPDDASLDAPWFRMQYAFQQSNFYAANTIPFKLRSVGIDEDAVMHYQAMPEAFVEELSIAEHNRWNLERLLVGFKAYTYEERMAYKARFTSKDESVRKEVKEEHNKRKKEEFMNKDIAPYGELLEGSRNYDRNIVRNLLDVMR